MSFPQIFSSNQSSGWKISVNLHVQAHLSRLLVQVIVYFKLSKHMGIEDSQVKIFPQQCWRSD